LISTGSSPKRIEQEESGGILQVLGIIIAAVVVIALTVVTWGSFATVGGAILGALTGSGSAAFTGVAATATAVAAVTVVGAAVIGGGIGFAGAFLSTIIATGNFEQAFLAGLIGLAVGFVAGGLVKVPIINTAFGTIGNAIQPAFVFVSDASRIATSFVSQLVTKAVGDALTAVLDKVVYGQGSGAFGSQFLLGLGLFALTAFAAAEIGHIGPLESLWSAGPSIEVANRNILLTEEFIKPELQGLAAYGIGEGLGIKDPEALGIGAAAGSFVAPWVMATTNAYFRLNPGNGATVYQSANPVYAGSVAPDVASQITGLIGGLASYSYDGDFSFGQFGATQVFNNNDIHVKWTDKDGHSREYVYEDGKPDVYVTLDLNNNIQLLDTLELMNSPGGKNFDPSDFRSLYNQWVNNYAHSTGAPNDYGPRAALDAGDQYLSTRLF
jgi:hypothetical protein